MYIPMRQCGDYGAWELIARSTLPLPVLTANTEAALRPIAPDLPRKSMRPLTDLVDRAVSPRRFIVLLLSGFAGFALILASLGIYALISYSVNQRTHEIGIRMALGATAASVRGQIVLRTLALATMGLLIGLFASWGLTRVLTALLFGVNAGDPVTFCGAAFLLIAIAALAGYLPARRASKIDPMICLRSA
jgi:ABC-type antimicrobial peptide transport system permease subunit